MVKTKDSSNIYIWYDTEFSSLDMNEARLMQVAAVITDHTLTRILPAERDLNLCVALPEDTKCSAWVNQHLQPLVQQCRSDGALSLAEVNSQFAAYIDAAVGEPTSEKSKRPLFAGNSLQCDLQLAHRDLPDIVDRVNYRVVDVSSWKMVWQNSYKQAPFDKATRSNIAKYFPGEYNSAEGAHDAHFDVLASIAELNFYLKHLTLTPA